MKLRPPGETPATAASFLRVEGHFIGAVQRFNQFIFHELALMFIVTCLKRANFKSFGSSRVIH